MGCKIYASPFCLFVLPSFASIKRILMPLSPFNGKNGKWQPSLESTCFGRTPRFLFLFSFQIIFFFSLCRHSLYTRMCARSELAAIGEPTPKFICLYCQPKSHPPRTKRSPGRLLHLSIFGRSVARSVGRCTVLMVSVWWWCIYKRDNGIGMAWLPFRFHRILPQNWMPFSTITILTFEMVHVDVGMESHRIRFLFLFTSSIHYCGTNLSAK